MDESVFTASDPYEVLEINPEASAAEIKQAYLAKVRAHPPEKDPDAFKAIRRAYDSLKDDKSRAALHLESPSRPPFLELEDSPLWNAPFQIDWKRFVSGDPAHDLTRTDFEAEVQTLKTYAARRQER